MFTRQRLLGLKDWAYENFCKGRVMKAPAPDMNITKVTRQEPCCYVGWAPARPDARFADTAAVAPGILIMPGQGSAKSGDIKPPDGYGAVRKNAQFTQSLSVTFLLSVYEPGIRLEGFDGKDYSLIREATQEGLFTLTDWMDELRDKLITDKCIPGTDLVLIESETVYSLYSEQGFVADKRPLFYGYINAAFSCYAQESINPIHKTMLL